MTRYPSRLILEITPSENGSGTATLRAGEWLVCPPEEVADCRILPVSGEIEMKAQTGQIRVEIKFSAVGPKQPPDPPLIVLP
jgi:hypothetical protein